MGRGLDEIVGTLAQRPSSSYTPASSVITLRKQARALRYSPSLYEHGSVYEEPLGKNAVHMVGDFYDGVGAATFGFTHGSLDFEYDGNRAYPDFVDLRNRRGWEIKSSGVPVVDFRHRQIGYLGEFQDKNPDFDVFYGVFRRQLSSSPLKEMTRSELFSFLTDKNTLAYSLVLPYSIIHHLYGRTPNTSKQRGNAPLYHYHGTGPEWKPRMRLHATTVDALATDPVETVASLGLNPANYSFGRYHVPSLSLQETSFAPFPLIWIADTPDFHQAWVARFREGYPANVAPPVRPAAPADPLYDPQLVSPSSGHDGRELDPSYFGV